MELEFDLSDELKEIIKDSTNYAEKNSGSVITLENIICHLISYYLDGKGKESKNLSEALSKLSDELKANLKAMLIVELGKSTKSVSVSLPKELMGIDEGIPSSTSFENVIKRAKANRMLKGYVSKDKQAIIDTEDVLDACLFEENRRVVQALRGYGIDRQKFLSSTVDDLADNADMDNLNDLFGGIKFKTSDGSNIDDFENFLKKMGFGNDEKSKPKTMSKEEQDKADSEFMKAGEGSGAINTRKVDPNSKTKNLDQFAIDMTAKAKEGGYEPVIGRDLEITKMLEALCCKKKNNVLLLGDPGTGKTSVVELLAQRIASGNVPTELKDKRIFNLDLNSMVAGTQFRGQYEERLQNVIEEVVNSKNIIVFIDEFHNLIGHGGGRDGQGADQVLKPYLARGEFQCIGSTTVDEYRKLVENDKALDRRFQPILVGEPTVEETKIILKGIAPTYSKFHHVKYTDEILEKCVDWSEKYINNLFFPDKAIGILDKASAKTKLNSVTPINTEIDDLQKKIDDLTKEKINITLNEPNRWGEMGELRQEISRLKTDLQAKKLASGSDDSAWPTVTIDDVSKSISELSGVPIDKIMSSDMGKVKNMYDEFTKKVIGQDEAAKEVTTALQRNILGLRDPHKPIASFLFVGPTGVGKTHISKILAKEFMGSEKNLETIACSEYMNEVSETKLLGSAPGYVGFESTEPRLYVFKRKPYSVLLVDEIEKSSSKLYSIWLNILEEGEVTLSSGEKISLRNCIVIFTGNVGTKSLELKGDGMGFSKPEGDAKKKADVETVMKEVKKEFRPEFLNRINKIVVFNSLEKEDLRKIFSLELEKLQNRLKETNYNLSVTDKVRDMIVDKCEPQYGARSLQRLIIENIENNICSAMLENNVDGKKNITVDVVDEKINVNFK